MTDLKKLSERATAGPWAQDDLDPLNIISVAETEYTPALGTYTNVAMSGPPANAAFIVALVNAYRSGALTPAPAGDRAHELEVMDAVKLKFDLP